MRKKRTTPLNLHRETIRVLDPALRQVAGAGGSAWCDLTNSCVCEYETHTGGTDCCQ